MFSTLPSYNNKHTLSGGKRLSVVVIVNLVWLMVIGICPKIILRNYFVEPFVRNVLHYYKQKVYIPQLLFRNGILLIIGILLTTLTVDRK